MSLYSELKRRNVFRVAIAYLAAAWLITEVSETLFPLFGYGETPARVVVILLAIGFPLFLIFSWVYELTPEGLKLERDITRDESITPQTGKRIDRFIIVLLAFGMAYFATDKFVFDPIEDIQIARSAHQVGRSEALTESYGDHSIAVLPFLNMSSDPEQEYFSDGVSEELLNYLSKIPQLRVISRSSAFSFKGKHIDIPTIAAQLGVAHIIEGSVRKDGNQVRITAQLIEGRSDTHLWSETYDRELENTFALQDEISRAITAALKESLGLQVEVLPQTVTAANIEAHDAFLKGRFLVIQRTRETVEQAVFEFEKAIALDPEYALAHAELAIAIVLLWKANYGDLTFTQVVARATPHAHQAMVLDPKLAEAHAATGLLLGRQSETEGALAHLRKAIEINPNYSIVHNWMANILGFHGHYEESFLMKEKALRLDPLSKPAIYSYVMELISRDRLDEANRELQKIASIYPAWYSDLQGELTGVHWQWAELVLGSLDSLLIEQTSVRVRNDLHFELALIGLEKESVAVYETPSPEVLRILGKPDAALAVAEAGYAQNMAGLSTYRNLGMAFAASGDYERARPILEDMWKRSGEQVAQFDVINGIFVAALAAARLHASEEAGVGNLLAAMRDDARRLREAGIITASAFQSADFEEGLAVYLAGEHKKGLELIAKAAEGGYFILPNEAYLQPLYDDPGFAPIMAGQLTRQARERNRFLAIVCTDNPYREVWQTERGTCERFAARNGY